MSSIHNATGIARNICVRTALFLLAALCFDAFAASPVGNDVRWRSSNYPVTGYFSTAQASCDAVVAKNGGTFVSMTNYDAVNMRCTYKVGTSTYNDVIYKYTLAVCADGSVADTTKPTASQCPDPVQTKCAGYDSAVAAATAYQYLSAPITCTPINASGVTTCSGTDSATGKPASEDIACGAGSGGSGTGAKPDPVPNPPPATDVDYPKCPVGTYKYTDIDGSTSCSRPERSDDAQPCASGNVGTINGRYTCLPSNPAPNVAKTAADAAQAKEQTAKNNPGTDAAKAAATGAAADAQRATDAANSLPSSDPASGGTVNDAGRAVNAAKQAAGYAGQPYTGPGGAANGTPGPNECGSPGKPKCNVIVDETGTPSGAADMSSAKTALTASEGAAKDGISGAISGTGKNTNWTFSFALPSACTPFEVYLGVVLDPCKYQEKIHALMSMVWIMSTIAACLSMVGNAIRTA